MRRVFGILAWQEGWTAEVVIMDWDVNGQLGAMVVGLCWPDNRPRLAASTLML